ncbi:MAG TPA: histidine kinase [Chthoniobacteraceae bacterium]|jgi:two-component sensor histidine kinase|nr:histidine kinase [Chthoniobacteraceae bacterium]
MKTAGANWKRFWTGLSPITRAWVLSFLCWGIVACSLGAEAAARTRNVWLGAVMPALRDWLPWALLSPPIFWLVKKLPIDRQRWKVALPVHIACAISTVVLCQWWKQTIDPPGALQTGILWPMTAAAQGARGVPGTEQAFWRSLGAYDMLRMATFDVPIYLMLVSGAHTLTFYRRTQDRDSSLAIARAEAQKMQLQPHFLFNTLNMIAELVHEEPDKADAMLIALSGLLRLTMETAGEQELPLRRELEFIERYLTIMHARFDDRLKFQLGIDPATNAALVPTFLLQPLVENAVEHGVGPRMAGGVISIRARRVGDTLHLCVSDNGMGLNGQKPGLEGIGLGNTRNRLRELYGERAKLEMQDTGGLIVEISIPFHLE